MAKRKAEFNAVEKYTKTPRKNIQESEFSAEFTDNNNAIRFQNRNSKQGKKGRSDNEGTSKSSATYTD
ncbi:hypothetical protein RCG24_09295 [Neobacillus sp. OS1-32]|jgi:hypothetical protein|uniref:Uncharacterized protein n=1 Tax=Neobacillus paridis TaxID=2803862 RepID=A0ABS1TMI9_9BACI|nr:MULTISPECIES: hypothetical protein [Neobacillus]MBL4952467.1 hypothetical protein [Neobacillus paridis]WML32007.1 hypothetical protein RCG24_09295 [Neobacillus sp. OS1-32]